jgi:fermentation-respiration switch protein FrsA (DUF1100 family)
MKDREVGHMRVEREQWGGIPLLHVATDENFEKQVPVVFFLHGHTSAKEHNLHYAYNLAEKGLRVILPDAILHGERSEEVDDVQITLRFWEIVLTSLEELKVLKEETVKRGYASEGKIGVAGTSMGGITTLGALKLYPWINAAAVMMGAPGYVQLAKAQIKQYESRGFKLPMTAEEREKIFAALEYVDLTKHLQTLNQRPLFFWHGEQDPTVPFEPTYNFYEAIREDYQEVPKRLHFIREANAGHAVSRKGMLASVDWLADHLNVSMKI